MIKETLEIILNILIPQKCIGCSAVGNIICENCLFAIPKYENIFGTDNFSVFSYKDPIIKEAIHLLKYKKVFSIAKPIAKHMYETVFEEISQINTMLPNENKQKIIVIPVPLHKNRLKERGYNQSEILAEEIIKNNKEDFEIRTNILNRIKETESQVSKISREKRLKNLKNAFFISKPKDIEGRIILLIDDVITTGATIEECRKTLEKYGPKKVIAISLAH